MIILMFGPNAVGKSTSATELAGRLKHAAHVEADLLTYMVVGGLTAWSAGLRPWKHREEYRKQLDLRRKNTAALACNFDDCGFDCVVEGLDVESEGPGTGWAEENLSEHDVQYVAVVCDPELAVKRIKKRDGVTRDTSEYIEWQKAATEFDFDYVMDTSTLPVSECITKCAAALNLDLTETASVKGIDWHVIHNKDVE